jgi:hypothetical protein
MTPHAWRLDDLLPTYDFNERHSRVIGSEPHAVYEAFKTLTRGRCRSRGCCSRSAPCRIAWPVGAGCRRLEEPLLDQFLELGFVLLADVPGQELIAGGIGRMWRRGGDVVRVASAEEFVAFAEPGFAKAAMTFRFSPRGDGATLAETETRVAATDPSARRAFGRYWILIRGFSGLVRRDWRRAVAQRAASAGAA